MILFFPTGVYMAYICELLKTLGKTRGSALALAWFLLCPSSRGRFPESAHGYRNCIKKHGKTSNISVPGGANGYGVAHVLGMPERKFQD